ncbi:hypothetical protein PCANC_04587 [Puccinia coronata f. sp. avenae]|uniref:Uncharacterized protein n=1 Tax=Puccinia coronata f. sp. avenae TaxID=200324 RepID=A0A2N5W087_9BASI|nr:hypothetical protein PCANC_21548 [Puccinia coronata f. sp. avenae]PLW55674.1 hypothetical protein PCANC_04587 [Puccinia coronata f. sp. avenae]
MVAPLLGAGAPTHALTQLVFGGDLITLVHRRSPSQFHWSDQRSLSWSDERPFGPVDYSSFFFGPVHFILWITEPTTSGHGGLSASAPSASSSASLMERTDQDYDTDRQRSRRFDRQPVRGVL